MKNPEYTDFIKAGLAAGFTDMQIDFLEEEFSRLEKRVEGHRHKVLIVKAGDKKVYNETEPPTKDSK